MPAPTDNWDESLPADSRNPQLGALDIRQHKRQLRERSVNGGQIWESGAPALDVNAGKLTCGVQGTTGELNLAHAEDDVVLVQLRDDTATGNASQLRVGDGIDGSEPIKVVADSLAGKRIHPVGIPLQAAATGRVDGIYYYNNTGFTITILEADLYANLGPSGGALTVDIHLHATGWTDLSSGGTTILTTPATDLSIADATGSPARLTTPVTSFADATLATGEVLAFEVDALNAAGEIMLFLKVQRVDL